MNATERKIEGQRRCNYIKEKEEERQKECIRSLFEKGTKNGPREMECLC